MIDGRAITSRDQEERVAYVFPGQGAQWVGMGQDLYHNFSSAREVFHMADEALEFNLTRLCFEGSEEELRQTIYAQPAVLTVSIACLKAAQEVEGDCELPVPYLVAGHSLGEYTALVAAGVVDLVGALGLVQERGRLMHQAGQINPGGMVAILGVDHIIMEGICQETGAQIANVNCPGQIAISGTKEALAQTIDKVKAIGVRRTVALDVSGAFHSPLMKPAYDGMLQAISSCVFSDAGIPLVANTSGQPLKKAEAIKDELINQLCHCVQWQKSIEYMIAEGVSTFIEIGPGQVLSGLIKRIDKGVKIVSIRDVPSIKAGASCQWGGYHDRAL